MQSVLVCEVRNLGIAIIHHPRSKTEENASLWRTTQLAVRGHVQEVKLKPGFHMSGKSQILLVYRIIATSLSQRRDVYVWKGTGAQQRRELVMSEIHRRRPRRYKFEFSFVGNDRLPSQKSGTRRENRNAPDSPDLSPSISDDRGYLRFRVFTSRHNLGQSGNSKIPDRLGFSRHMKTRLYGNAENSNWMTRK